MPLRKPEAGSGRLPPQHSSRRPDTYGRTNGDDAACPDQPQLDLLPNRFRAEMMRYHSQGADVLATDSQENVAWLDTRPGGRAVS
jgi:hypothetical protein